ncbi:MAG: hypothetical protein NZ899_06895 [Thermoguttaceae bacterium]|nr:hypothetical protein [Thermoguttaceae bacterium]MDW8078505.1 hypothetical protein [Thermoguttaceae bacterium]
MKARDLGWLVALLTAGVFIAGCGGQPGVSTVPVTGTVLVDGSPAAGIAVTFSPKSPEARVAAGVTDASGRFTLNTAGAGQGAVPGTYAVAFAVSGGGQAAPTADPRAAGGALTPEQMKEIQAQQTKRAPTGPALKLPAKYGSPDTSGFTVEVKAGAPNDFKFELTTN